MKSPTWEEVKARSVAKLGDLETFCGTCYIAYEATGFPCAAHCTPEERDEAIKPIKEASMREHPFFAMVPKGKSYE